MATGQRSRCGEIGILPQHHKEMGTKVISEPGNAVLQFLDLSSPPNRLELRNETSALEVIVDADS